jgi:hypothetical protein
MVPYSMKAPREGFGVGGLLVLALLLALAILLVARPVEAQTCSGGTCVPPEDMAVFVKLLRDQKCRNETKPEFKLDPVTIVTDQEGRVFVSGGGPKPYALTMVWCNYEVRAEGKVDIVVAVPERPEEPTWGLRFRPKFSSGLLVFEAFRRDPWTEAIDVGALWDVAFYKLLSLNFATGLRSSGVGIGVDITKNFGGYLGYAMAYSGLRHNPYVGLSFAF